MKPKVSRIVQNQSESIKLQSDRIKYLLFLWKSPEHLWFSDDFKGIEVNPLVPDVH